ELLAEHLNHTSADVRMAVIEVIRAADRKDLSGELIERARQETDPRVRAQVYQALHGLGAREAIPIALEALADSDDRVRAAATALVGDLGGSELAGSIQPRATDPDSSVRAAAARALGLIKAQGVDRDFTLLLADPIPTV